MTLPTFQIVYEDPQLLVVNKPAGLATMGVSPEKPSLLAALQSKLAASTGTDPFIAILGRLDYPVSGLVVIAKDPFTADRLTWPRQGTEIGKTYHAVVAGSPQPPAGAATHWLLKSRRRRSVSVVPEGTDEARIGKLQYRVLRRNRQISLLSVELLTGRKHQIRAQLAAMGNPVLGDRKYGSRWEHFPEGIALICKQVVLTHPRDARVLRWEAEYPRSWRETLQQLDDPRC